MKVNNRRRVKMSKRTSAIIVLCVALVLTLAVGYLGLNGTWLDSRGLYKLLPGCLPLMWTTGRSPSPWAWTSRAACMWNMKRP